MKIKKILILIFILFICSYLDKNNVHIKEDSDNQYLSKIVYGAKNIGVYINNIKYNNLYSRVNNSINIFIKNNTNSNDTDSIVDNISINLDGYTSSAKSFINKGVKLLNNGTQILDKTIENLNNISN